MIFLIKGESSPVIQQFGHRLTEALDLPHPDWPLGDDHEKSSWEAALEDLPVGDFRENFAVPFVDVDRVAGLVYFRSRDRYPMPPDWREEVARVGFWPWMGDRIKEVLGPELLPEVFGMTCQMIDSAPHAVVLGGTLGLSPANSTLARMILFKYSRTPTLKMFVQRGAAAEGSHGDDIALQAQIDGKSWSLPEVLARLSPTADGQYAFDSDSSR